jgi:archaellum component FlaF (FlaF/FlaG flagellin family)
MFKKLLIAIGAIIVLIVVLVIVAGVIVSKKVDKEFISAQMAKALNRQVHIEKIDVSIFSVLSGIEVENVDISNFKTPRELEGLQGKMVAAGDAFASMKSLRFKIKIMPLLKKQVELKELVLYSPVINLSKNRQGVLNIDDLTKSKKQPADKEKNEPSKPLTADDIPMAVAIGEIGMKDGTINYYDGEHDQRFQIYKLTTLAHDISIDPKDLEKKDEIKINFGMGIKTVGTMKTGSVKSFDVTINATGRVIPFDNKTRLLGPEAIVHIAVPDGEITGLEIFKSIAAIPILGDYLGEYISFLKDKQHWKDSKETGLDIHYKADKVEITNGKLDLKEAKIIFDGSTNIKTKAIDMNVGMVMNKEINEAVQTSLAKRIDSLIKSPDVKKYADSGKLAEAAMKPLLNREGLIDLKTKVKGTTNKPEVKLVQPQLDTLGEVVKSAAGSVAIEAGKGVAKEAVKKVLTEDQQKVLEGVGDLFNPSKKK